MQEYETSAPPPESDCATIDLPAASPVDELTQETAPPALTVPSRKPMAAAAAAALGLWLAATTLVSAFLVFQVQPVISRMILPWFGGGPAVWTTCLLFFQLLLLAGYAYAFALDRLLPVKWQALVQLGLVVAAACLLPITPDPSWKPIGASHPAVRILWLLLTHVGMPYFLLAATSPLIQVWYSSTHPGNVPYRFYALSNLGSLVALLSFPLVVEPMLTTSAQGLAWSAGFVVYAVLCLWLAICLVRRVPALVAATTANKPQASRGRHGSADLAEPGDAQTTAPSTDETAPRFRDWALWILLSALGSTTLLAVTNQICQEIAVVPLLWVIPLSLYLVTFIICFDRPHWFAPRWWGLAALAVTLTTTFCRSQYLAYVDRALGRWSVPFSFGQCLGNILVATTLWCAVLFLICMACHGQLVRHRPPRRWLTSFYLAVATGGAIGGLLVAIVCPLVFSTLAETEWTLCAGLVLGAYLVASDGWRHWPLRRAVLCYAAGMAMAGVYLVASRTVLAENPYIMAQFRGFYGTLQVDLVQCEDGSKGLALFHGQTLHGFQYRAEDRRREPTTYYDRDSGVGLTLASLGRQGPLHVGVVGLGTGTLAAYGRQGDRYDFYDINPTVVKVAREYFTYLADSPAKTRITLGDARIMLERQPPQAFDVLALDAFSGDAIPVHLLTLEAFRVYQEHMRPDGVIAVHISNRYVDLLPVVAGAAERGGLTMVVVRASQSDNVGEAASDWVLLTKNERFVRDLSSRASSTASDCRAVSDLPPRTVWTDQYSSLLGLLR